MENKSSSINDDVEPVLVAGGFRPASFSETFQAYNPATGEKLPSLYPVSSWRDLELALKESHQLVPELAWTSPEKRARFFTLYAELLEKRRLEIISRAYLETALPAEARLNQSEFPR
ncbi:MAG TPA: aldehyde dehydrogenase family protein, partial [Candidatus Saccharicenans sp.]|nr:aldehyde dehydrogenase family protein [Candidatus Saccharicenans sp.]